MSATAVEPRLLAGPPPPIRVDRRVQVWVLAMTASWLGDALWTVALGWTAAHRLDPALAGLVLGIETVPQAVLVMLGGVIADRFDTRRVVVLGQLGQAAVLLAGASAWVAGAPEAATLICIAIGFGTTSGLTIPAGATLARQLVRGEDLGTVSGWNQIGSRAGRVAGAPLGGILVTVGGPAVAMVADAATFAVVAAVVAAVLRPRYEIAKDTHDSWRTSLLGGLGYLRRTTSARLLVMSLATLNVFVSPVIALGVSLRCSDSGWGAGWVGVADATLAVGAVAGSLVAIRRRPLAPARAGLLTLVIQGAALACVGLDSRWVLLGAMAIVGLTAGSASVWLSGVFQRTVAPSHLGRVSSVNNLGDLALIPIAVPTFGLVARGSGVLVATAVFGAAMGLLCGWFGTRPALRRLR